MRYLRKFFPALALALAFLLASSCGNLRKIKDISLSSCGVKYITPVSLRSLEGVLLLAIDNPALSFTVSDVDGMVKYYEKPLVSFTAGELPLQGKSAQVYELPCSATLAEKVSFLDILALISKRSLEGLQADVTLHVTLPNGMGTSLRFKDIDLSQFSQ